MKVLLDESQLVGKFCDQDGESGFIDPNALKESAPPSQSEELKKTKPDALLAEAERAGKKPRRK